MIDICTDCEVTVDDKTMNLCMDGFSFGERLENKTPVLTVDFKLPTTEQNIMLLSEWKYREEIHIKIKYSTAKSFSYISGGFRLSRYSVERNKYDGDIVLSFISHSGGIAKVTG